MTTEKFNELIIKFMQDYEYDEDEDVNINDTHTCAGE